MPGEFYFGQGDFIIKTLLGSCVAATMWHPRLRIGGMCHVVIPDDNETVISADCDARYAGCAMRKFIDRVKKSGMPPRQFQVGLYGGGIMFANVADRRELDIGTRNVEIMRYMLSKHGFYINQEDVSLKKYRHVLMELGTGEVSVRAVDLDEQRRKQGA